jgi:hypothetical protein
LFWDKGNRYAFDVEDVEEGVEVAREEVFGVAVGG